MKLYPERLNKAYDRAKDPWRFIIAMTLISPGFVLQSLPLFWQAIVIGWCGLLGFCRSAYLCKLEFVPRRNTGE